MLERLPGTDLGHVITRLTAEQRRAIAREIALIQDIVATFPSAKRYGYAVRPEDAPHESWRAMLQAMLDRSRRRIEETGVMDPACVDRVREAVQKRKDFDHGLARCFLHDTTTKNVIVNEGRLAGIVDIDEFCYGDPRLAPALTWMSLLISKGPIDYVIAWIEQAKLTMNNAFLIYAAIFCVDFMAEIGQRFNRDSAEKQAAHGARLTDILKGLLAVNLEG